MYDDPVHEAACPHVATRLASILGLIIIDLQEHGFSSQHQQQHSWPSAPLFVSFSLDLH